MCIALSNARANLLSCTKDGPATPGVDSEDSAVRCNCNGPVSPSPLSVGSRLEQESYLTAHSWADALFEEDGLADNPYFGTSAFQMVVVRHPHARQGIAAFHACWFSSCVVILLLPAIKSCPLCHRFVSHLLHERLAQNLDPENVEVTAAHISGAIMNALRSPKGLGGLGSYWAQHTNNFFTRFLAGRTRYSGVSPCAGVLLHLLH